jgi:hypothetical protein
VDLAIAQLSTPDHPTYDSVVDIGGRRVSVRHPGRGHTDADLIVVAAWPGTLDRLLAAGGPDAVYVPGHGAVVDTAFIRRQQGWLRRISPL